LNNFAFGESAESSADSPKLVKISICKVRRQLTNFVFEKMDNFIFKCDSSISRLHVTKQPLLVVDFTF